MDPQNHNHLVIDEGSADVVRLIFDLALADKTLSAIAEELKDKKLIIPAIYKAKQGDTRFSEHLSKIDIAAVGALFLMMEEEKQGSGIYHARVDCWQQYFGYNDIYDWVFDVGTDMEAAKFGFDYNGVSYMLWAWKDDYINLGAGAELGIYTGNGWHKEVDTGLAMPMCMTLSHNGSEIINYNPQTPQW